MAMTSKKEVTKNALIDLYTNYVLQHGKNPASVYTFCKTNGFDEAEFYNHFASFQTIARAVFSNFFHRTITLLQDSKEYPSYSSRNKLLSFYFTFFEILTANRSYVVQALSHNKHQLKALSLLSALKADFSTFVDELSVDLPDLGERIEKVTHKTLLETAWAQLLFTIKFWLDDTSPAFEKTDILIEKSVNSGFDLLDNPPLKSLVDLGKFLLKEKRNATNGNHR